jgi:hypothetical protein
LDDRKWGVLSSRYFYVGTRQNPSKELATQRKCTESAAGQNRPKTLHLLPSAIICLAGLPSSPERRSGRGKWRRGRCLRTLRPVGKHPGDARSHRPLLQHAPHLGRPLRLVSHAAIFGDLQCPFKMGSSDASRCSPPPSTRTACRSRPAPLRASTAAGCCR